MANYHKLKSKHCILEAFQKARTKITLEKGREAGKKDYQIETQQVIYCCWSYIVCTEHLRIYLRIRLRAQDFYEGEVGVHVQTFSEY